MAHSALPSNSTRKASNLAREFRRFVAQVKRNWLILYAAMSMQGHVVITFNVHKDGTSPI